jgi:peptidylprolyl isomerase
VKNLFKRFLMIIMGCFSIHNLHAEESLSMAAKRPVVVVETNKGNFEVTLFPEIAPKACENFIGLAKNSKYDGVKFHRVIPGFMIQGGDYERQNGTGGKSIWEAPFEDECNPAVKFDKPGLLAMANAGPKTNGSQFFITTAATSWLQGKHTIFGEVTKGMEVIRAIESLGSRSGETKESLKIIKVYPKGNSSDTPSSVGGI